MLASNVAEGLETLYLEGVIGQGLKLVYMWMSGVKKVEDCGKTCVFKFWVKMSERVRNESGGDWKGCTMEARTESGKIVKIEKVVSCFRVFYIMGDRYFEICIINVEYFLYFLLVNI